MFAGVRAATASSDFIISDEPVTPFCSLSRESEEQSGSLSFICAPELRAASAFFFSQNCCGAAVRNHNRKKKKTDS